MTDRGAAMKAYDYIDAAAVPKLLKVQEFGDWQISRHTLPLSRMISDRDYFTCLRKKIYVEPTIENIHKFEHDGSEYILDVVMEDTPQELSRHLPIWMNGYGHVLKTGLGLGCVVRGLLQNNSVDQISVVEIDEKIINTIGQEFKGNNKVKIFHGDALNFNYETIGSIDCAWHDIWTPENRGLQMLHAKLMVMFKGIHQGAWAFPRDMKRLSQKKIGNIIG